MKAQENHIARELEIILERGMDREWSHGVSFDAYQHNHPLLYEFMKITLATVKELRNELPLQTH